MTHISAFDFWRALQFFTGQDGLFNSREYTYEIPKFMTCMPVFETFVRQIINNNCKAPTKKTETPVNPNPHQEVLSRIKQLSWTDIAISGHDGDEQAFLFVMLPSLKKNDTMHVLGKISKRRYNRLIICAADTTNNSIKLLHERISHVEIFSFVECFIQAHRHKGQPSLKRICRDDVKVIGDEGVTKLMFSCISKTDPLIKFFGLDVDDVVQITRARPDGFTTEYRRVK